MDPIDPRPTRSTSTGLCPLETAFVMAGDGRVKKYGVRRAERLEDRSEVKNDSIEAR